MVWCNERFDAFDTGLHIGTERSKRIESALTHLRDFIRSDEELSQVATENIFVQGSVSYGTVVKPIHREEFDVDVVSPLNTSLINDDRPDRVFAWFTNRLLRDSFFDSNHEIKNRCIRIDYAGDFHMDIVPARRDQLQGDLFEIPARDLGAWELTDPIGFRSWVNDLSDRSGVSAFGDGFFRRGVRMCKRMRDERLREDIRPSSILFTTMLGKHEPTGSYSPPLKSPLFPTYKTDAAYIFDMLRLTLDCYQAPPAGAFHHPTLTDKNLGAEWTEAHLAQFLDVLRNVTESMSDAIYSDDEGLAIGKCADVFGSDF